MGILLQTGSMLPQVEAPPPRAPTDRHTISRPWLAALMAGWLIRLFWPARLRAE